MNIKTDAANIFFLFSLLKKWNKNTEVGPTLSHQKLKPVICTRFTMPLYIYYINSNDIHLRYITQFILYTTITHIKMKTLIIHFTGYYTRGAAFCTLQVGSLLLLFFYASLCYHARYCCFFFFVLWSNERITYIISTLLCNNI